MDKKQIIQSDLTDVISQRFARYAKYIIQDRALPDVRDGLKPVQRRILYAMWEDGNTYDKQYRKSVKSVGLVIGNYHPHGESSVYDAMVRMSQPWKTSIPLIDMHGNNGSMDDDPAAAMRYTEARLSHLTAYLLKDIEKDTVHFAYNFDDTTIEPTVLPARFPNLLVNGISGIAAGYATNIPPHNLQEVLEASIFRLKHPNSTLSEIMEFVKGPDFPTGGIIQGLDGIKKAFETGKGRIVVRGKVEHHKLKTHDQLIITEIPYEVIKSNLVRRIDEIRFSKVIDGILDVRDESDRNGLKIVIDIKKSINHELILQYLYKHSELQIYYNYNVVAIVEKRPQQLGLLQMLDAFIEHRKEVVNFATNFELQGCLKRLHIVEGLIEAVSVLDEIIRIIRLANDKADAKIKLINAFAFSEEQAEAIVTLRLYRLSNTDIVKLENESKELNATISNLRSILEEEKVLKKVIIKQLEEVKKMFGEPRRSKIEEKVEELTITKEQLINNEQVMVTLSKDGYGKKVSLRSYLASDKKPILKDGDKNVLVKEAGTLQKVLFFTTQGTYGYFNIYDLIEAKWRDIGQHINSQLKMDAKEKIKNAYVVTKFKTYGYIVSVTKKGMIKKTKIADYEVSRNNKTMVSMQLQENDEVIKSLVAYDFNEILLVTKKGYVARYPVDLIATLSPRSKGIKAMRLEEDEIVDVQIIDNSKNQIVVFNDKMQSKRLKLSDILLTGRNVKGEMIFKQTKTNPNFIKQLLVVNVEDSLLLTNYDTILVKEIPIMNKQAGFSSVVSIEKDLSVIEQYDEIKVEAVPVLERVEEVEYEIGKLDI